MFSLCLLVLSPFHSQRGRRAGGSSAPVRRPAPPAARPAPPRPAAPVAAAQQSHVPAVPQQSSGGGGMLSGIGSTIMQGMAFGTGSAIAHRAVGAVAGGMSGSGGEAAPASMAAAPEYASGAMSNNNNSMTKPDVCMQDRQIYYDCIRDNRDDQAVCSFLLEQLKSCQQNQMYSS